MCIIGARRSFIQICFCKYLYIYNYMITQRFIMGVRWDFVQMYLCMGNKYGCVHKKSKESAVVYHSLNYTQLYEIDVGTHGLFSFSQIWLYLVVGTRCIYPYDFWRAYDTLSQRDLCKSNYILPYFVFDLSYIFNGEWFHGACQG